jgi:hypothetical protein
MTIIFEIIRELGNLRPEIPGLRGHPISYNITKLRDVTVRYQSDAT